MQERLLVLSQHALARGASHDLENLVQDLELVIHAHEPHRSLRTADEGMVHARHVEAYHVPHGSRGSERRSEGEPAPEACDSGQVAFERLRQFLVTGELEHARQREARPLAIAHAQLADHVLCHLSHEACLREHHVPEHPGLDPFRVRLEQVSEIRRYHVHVVCRIVQLFVSQGRLRGAHQRIVPVTFGLCDTAGAAHRSEPVHLQVVAVPEPQHRLVVLEQVERVGVRRALCVDAHLVALPQLEQDALQVEHEVVCTDDGHHLVLFAP